MKVHELIKILQYYPQDYVVTVAWEDTFHEIDDDSIYISKDETDLNLYIDADGCCYKNDYQGISLTRDIATNEE